MHLTGECNRLGSQPHDETRICTGDKNNHITCDYDEGAPITVLHPTDNYWQVYGMVSKGSSCGGIRETATQYGHLVKNPSKTQKSS